VALAIARQLAEKKINHLVEYARIVKLAGLPPATHAHCLGDNQNINMKTST
jgi:hypothetical protein